MTAIGKTVTLCVVFISLVVGAFVYSTLQTPQLTDAELKERGVFILPRPRDLAPIKLLDHTGAPFTNDRLMNVWTFVFFGFTNCPDICPTSMAVLGQVERALQQEDPQLANQFAGLLVTVDPERDSPETLGQYATAFSPRFYGLRGTREETAELATQVNVAFAKVPDGDGYTMDHSGQIVVINPKGHFHGFIKLPHDAETIRLAFQTLAAGF